MKRLLTLIIFALIFQYNFGQACGIYHIKYSGSIKSISYEIEKIKLPTIQFLHGLKEGNSRMETIQIEPISQKVDAILSSHLTSHLYDNADDLLKLYKEKNDHFLITIILNVNGTIEEVHLNLEWSDIEISIDKDSKLNNVFELRFNKLYVK